MGPAKKTLLTVIVSMTCCACNLAPPNPKKNSALVLLSGYWIPKEIQWAPDSLGADASFQTLCFDSATRFFMFQSTHRQASTKGDSISITGQLLSKIFAGSWKDLDTAIEIMYSIIPLNTKHSDTPRNERIKILFNGQDTLLLYKQLLYRRTSRYDSVSRRRMDTLRATVFRTPKFS